MAKTLTNEVPLIVLSAAEYLKNRDKKQWAFFSKETGYFIDGRFMTVVEANNLYPTTHVKVVMRIHDKRGNLSTKNRP